jgi:hypothetical protein
MNTPLQNVQTGIFCAILMMSISANAQQNDSTIARILAKIQHEQAKKIIADPSREMQIFYFSRELDTGDGDQDFVIELDKQNKICLKVSHPYAL